MTDVLGGSQHSSGILRGTRPQPHTPTLSARRREPLPPLWLSPEERLCQNNQPVYPGAGLPELPTRPPQRWGSARNRLTPHGHAAAARSPERFGPRKEIPPAQHEAISAPGERHRHGTAESPEEAPGPVPAPGLATPTAELPRARGPAKPGARDRTGPEPWVAGPASARRGSGPAETNASPVYPSRFELT